MKNFLAIDTASNYLTVLAVVDGKQFIFYNPDCAMKHSASLMPALDNLLKEAGISLADFDFFAAVVGAGSFTGIRIGISAVKGFCLAFSKPALPITSFDIAAYNGKEEGRKQLILINALHGAYYVCGYENGKVILPPSYLTEAEVIALKETGYTLVSVEDLIINGEKIEKRDPVQGLYFATVKNLEEEKFGELEGLYVRKSQAEINLNKGDFV